MTITATKIRLKNDASGNDERGISQIYLIDGLSPNGFYTVEAVIKALDDDIKIKVSGYPNTYLEAVHESGSSSDYVRSQANGTKNDNLLKLPQE